MVTPENIELDLNPMLHRVEANSDSDVVVAGLTIYHTSKFPFQDVNLFPIRNSKFSNDFIIST
jgi:hypothetical protein